MNNMAITANDIREKQFETIMRGYNRDDVDDFLDEVAVQFDAYEETIARLNAEIESLKAAAEAAAEAKPEEAAPVEEVKPEPVPEVKPAPVPESVFNEPSYFKNLESTLRETLISAQRIADDTVNNANKQAAGIIADAKTRAEAMETEANNRLANTKLEYENIAAACKTYYDNLASLVKEQQEVLAKSPIAKM